MTGHAHSKRRQIRDEVPGWLLAGTLIGVLAGCFVAGLFGASPAGWFGWVFLGTVAGIAGAIVNLSVEARDRRRARAVVRRPRSHVVITHAEWDRYLDVPRDGAA